MKSASKMSDRELRSELTDCRRLLAEAKCPHDCIDGTPHGFPGRVIATGRLRENWYRCPFCAMRVQLIGNGD